MSIYTKRYTPLYAAAIIGSGADVVDAKVRCRKMADRLDDVIDERERLEAMFQKEEVS